MAPLQFLLPPLADPWAVAVVIMSCWHHQTAKSFGLQFEANTNLTEDGAAAISSTSSGRSLSSGSRYHVMLTPSNSKIFWAALWSKYKFNWGRRRCNFFYLLWILEQWQSLSCWRPSVFNWVFNLTKNANILDVLASALPTPDLALALA